MSTPDQPPPIVVTSRIGMLTHAVQPSPDRVILRLDSPSDPAFWAEVFLTRAALNYLFNRMDQEAREQQAAAEEVRRQIEKDWDEAGGW